jgi:hypothetical protein
MYHTRGNKKCAQIRKVKFHGERPHSSHSNIRLNMRELVCDEPITVAGRSKA